MQTNRRAMPNISYQKFSAKNHQPTSVPLNPSASYYNAAKNAVYSRYSTSDWEQSNRSNFSDAESQMNASERHRADTFRTVRILEEATRNRQDSNTRKLDQRVKDIGLWKEELLKEIHLMEEETANLLEHRRRLAKELAEIVVPLRVAEECLATRERRQGVDLVKDDVERCLNKEVDIIKKCQKQMQALLNKVDIQLKMNNAEQKANELDLANKTHAHGIDDRMQQLRNSSSRNAYHPGIEDMDNTITVPVTWAKFSEDNVTRSQHERDKSAKLRGAVDGLLRTCAVEMWTQHNAIESALNSRIHELNGAKAGLQAHLSRINNERLDLEKSIDLLRKTLADKEAPLKVAQTRLDERSRRIDVELCRDTPMLGLQEEVRELRETRRQLKNQLQAAELTMSRLLKSRATLERDIGVKENSIDLDSRLCVGLRKTLGRTEPARTGPSFNMSLAG